MAGTQGLWSVDGDGLVSVADDSVLRGVVQDAARRGAVSDVFVDSCVELFFRVLRARGCVVDDDAVRLALSGAAGELVCAVLPGGVRYRRLMLTCWLPGWCSWVRLCAVRLSRSRLVMMRWVRRCVLLRARG